MLQRYLNSPQHRFYAALFFSTLSILAIALDLFQQQMTYHIFVNWPGLTTDKIFTNLVILMENRCDIFQHRVEINHILEAWVCDNVDWVEAYQNTFPHKIHVFSYLKPNLGIAVVLYSGILLPIWGLYFYLRFCCDEKSKRLYLYGLFFFLTLITAYFISKILFYNFPPPHIYNPNDYFMDFWNVVFLASKGETYTQKGFYHPLLIFLASFFDTNNFENAQQMRDQNTFISVVCGFAIFVASILNYLSIRKQNVDINSFLVCFVSAPVIFLVSRLNLFFLAYLLVSILLFITTKKPKNSDKLNIILSTILPIIKPYFFIYFFLQNLRPNKLIKLVTLFVSLLIIGSFLYQTKYPINSVNIVAVPIEIFINTINFAKSFNRPFFEVLSLNYSVFSHINIVNHLLSVLEWESAKSILNYIFLFLKISLFLLSLLLITQNRGKLNERTQFMFFCIALLTFSQNIGGYVACILIPLVPEIRKVLNGKHTIFLAIIFCPIDFSAVIGFPNFILLSSPDELNLSQISFDILPIRKDVSVMAILRPLSLLWFWKEAISNGVFSRSYRTD